MRIAVPLALVSLFGALFPAVASAASPVATIGSSGFLTAVVVAGAGALVIALIMVVFPSARRGAGSSVSAAGPSTATAFRAHPVSSPSGDEVPAPSEPETPTPTPPAAPETAPEAAEESVAAPEASQVVAESPEPEQAAEPEPEPPASPEATPAPEAAPVPSIMVSAPVLDTVEASPAVQERSPVAIADPPRVRTTTPQRPEAPVPDLLSALAPAAVLGESFDPERVRLSMAAEPAPETTTADVGARALLRDHSLVVPIAACVLIGVTVHLARSRRSRH